jgi:hypothetical protein
VRLWVSLRPAGAARRGSVRLPAAGSLSLACPRESDQREGHPRCSRPPNILFGGFASAAGVFRRGILPRRKTACIPARRPVGPDPAALAAAHGAPSRARASCPQQQQHRSGYRSWAGRSPPALSGPLSGGGRAEEQPEGSPAGRPATFAPAQDVPSQTPAARTRTFRTGSPKGAAPGASRIRRSTASPRRAPAHGCAGRRAPQGCVLARRRPKPRWASKEK